jgi:hypothetical protein
VAWSATEGSRAEVYLADFPSFSGKRQISSDGGSHPEWSADGQELFFRQERQIMAVDWKKGAAGQPRALFAANMVNLGPQYAPLPDGKRFLINESNRQPEDNHIVVALNWLNEVR